MFYYFVDVIEGAEGLAIALTKPCVYCGAPVTITDNEEISFQARGINVVTLRVSCPSCDNRKIQPMQSEDG